MIHILQNQYRVDMDNQNIRSDTINDVIRKCINNLCTYAVLK